MTLRLRCPTCGNERASQIMLHVEPGQTSWSGKTWRCLVCQTVFESTGLS